MKPGFLAALRQTAATGTPPTPEPRARTGEEPLSPIHQQLLDSLAHEQAVSTHATSHVQVPTVQRVRAQSSRLKGTIEEVLGLSDPRAEEGDAGGPLRVDVVETGRPALPQPPPIITQAAAVVQSMDEAAALSEAKGEGPLARVPCHHCGASGFVRLRTGDHGKAWCGWCKGEGYVGTDGRPLPEALKEKEVALPFVSMEEANWTDEEVYAKVQAFDTSAEGPIRFPNSIAESNQGPDPRYRPWMSRCLLLAEREAREDTTLFPVPAPTAITYDLPTSVDDLPLFCYVSGPAGTGKTWLAKAWAASDPDGVVLAATTGIAAVNLGEGTTINALLRFYDTNSLRDAFTGGWLEAQIKRLRAAGLRRIVLDEVSMLDGDQLTILTRAIDNVNQDRPEGSDAPEVGLILVGDFAQLAPVKAPYAFESAEWARFQAATFGLTTIRRQGGDVRFIEALQHVRRGHGHEALEFFGPQLQATTDARFDGTTILAKNEAVEKFNQLRLDTVQGAPLTFASHRWGKLRPEWGGPPKPQKDWGVPETLKLKEGALVMILANKNDAPLGAPLPEYRYVNGDLGTVVSATNGLCQVHLQRTNVVVDVQPITRENAIPLEVGRKKALRAEGHPERISANGKQEVIGACTYMPLRLAWASTVHKSQGLSLDHVQVNMRDHFFASPGMLYVALSRARTAAGLRLVGSPESFIARCKTEGKVEPWL